MNHINNFTFLIFKFNDLLTNKFFYRILSNSISNDVEKGEYDSPDVKRVKIEKIIKYYQDYKNNRSSTKTYCKQIIRYLGNIQLHKLDANPHILVDFFQDFPKKEWSDKTVWNFFITLKAAISFWLKMKRLIMPNPCDVVPVLAGISANPNVREQAPTPQEFNRLIITCIEVGCFPWIIDLFCAVWESGLRIGEVLKWKVEEMCLRIELDNKENVTELPYFTTYISKQRRTTRKQIPMSYGLWILLKRVVGDRNEGDAWPVKFPPYRYIRKMKLMERAGLQQYRPFHDFRKSFKTARKKQGLSQEFTKFLQGHATNSMDDYYTQFKRLDVQDAYMETYRDQIETKKGGEETNK